jgi:VanZ family protein
MPEQLSKALSHFAARLPSRPAAYLCLFTLWLVTLCFLSASSPTIESTEIIPHLDKLLHFGYFSLGGGFLAAHCGLRWPGLSQGRLLLMVVIVCTIIGRLDEYHQGFVPGRSGNDRGDWLADTLGAVCGGWLVICYLLPTMRQGKGRKQG